MDNFSARGLIKDLYSSAKLYVLRNFEEVVAKSDELLEISINEIFNIINNDLLNIKDESLAWEGILRWIAFDPDKRIHFVPLLLTSVRLGILEFQVSFDIVKLELKIVVILHLCREMVAFCTTS